MEAEALKKLQNTELKILEAVTNLCEKHGITYFLDCGTLLGAIRHNGFIPWDDDIDITMPYEDYCHFLEIAQKVLGSEYFIQNHETEDHFFRPYTKVRLNGTMVIPREWEYWNVHHGAWIDVYPMFYSDSDKDIRRKSKIYKICQILQERNYYRSCMLHDKKTIRTTLKYLLLVFLSVIPIKTRKKIHSRLFRYICSKKNGQYLCFCGLTVRKHKKGSYLGPKTYHQFEQLFLRIPSDYNIVLRAEYGDYMQLPPESDRGNHGELLLDL